MGQGARAHGQGRALTSGGSEISRSATGREAPHPVWERELRVRDIPIRKNLAPQEKSAMRSRGGPWYTLGQVQGR